MKAKAPIQETNLPKESSGDCKQGTISLFDMFDTNIDLDLKWVVKEF